MKTFIQRQLVKSAISMLLVERHSAGFFTLKRVVRLIHFCHGVIILKHQREARRADSFAARGNTNEMICMFLTSQSLFLFSGKKSHLLGKGWELFATLAHTREHRAENISLRLFALSDETS